MLRDDMCMCGHVESLHTEHGSQGCFCCSCEEFDVDVDVDNEEDV